MQLPCLRRLSATSMQFQGRCGRMRTRGSSPSSIACTQVFLVAARRDRTATRSVGLHLSPQERVAKAKGVECPAERG